MIHVQSTYMSTYVYVRLRTSTYLPAAPRRPDPDGWASKRPWLMIYHTVVSQHSTFRYRWTMSAREVITVQCGHYSNFIGTHWWNLQVRPAVTIRSILCSLHSLQESGFCYDPTAKEPQELLNDCMFREGLTLTVSELVLIHVAIRCITVHH